LYLTRPVLLILGTYAARCAAATKTAVTLWGVGLALIHPGCTDQLQPVARPTLGVLKAHSRQLWGTYYHATNGAKATPSTRAQNLLTAWARIRLEIIKSSWDIFQETWENDDPDELNHRNNDTEFHPHMRQQDLKDLE
jgi:hypothetical protein